MDTTPVDDELLQAVAKKLHSRWKTLSTYLGINADRLKNIEGRNKSNPNNYRKGMAMLNEWKETAGNNATKENLQNALMLAGITTCLPL